MNYNYSVHFDGFLNPITKNILDEYHDQILNFCKNEGIYKFTFLDYDGRFNLENFGGEIEEQIDEEYQDSHDNYENEEYYEDNEYNEEYYDDDYDEDYLTYWTSGPLFNICMVDPLKIKDLKNGDIIPFENENIKTEFHVLDKEKGILINEGIFVDFTYGEKKYFDSDVYESVKDFEKECKPFLKSMNARNKIIDLSEKVKKEYKLDDHLNSCPKNTFNQIITGETGCGKTYKSINDEIKANRKFAYIAPCRQLVYETYRYYADKDKDMLTSGEVKINTEKDGNIFAVYESANEEMLKKVDTLIIDEAHFVKDPERGQHLLNLIATARENNINLKLLTATQNFELNGFEDIHLKSIAKVPTKKEISHDKAYENIKNGMQTIWFASTIEDSEVIAKRLNNNGIKAKAMNSVHLPSERLQTQIDFEKGDIQVVVATNVLAQGVNFTCQNLIIELDNFNTPELIQQKIGRLGRPGTLENVDVVYYSTYEHVRKIDKGNTVTKIKKGEVDRDYIRLALDNCLSKINCYYEAPSYNNLKYCIPELQKELNEMLKNIEDSSSVKVQIINETLDLIKNEQEKVKSIILSNMRKKEVLKENNKENNKKEFFKNIEKAIKENKSYVKFGNSQREFKLIPCSDLIEIDNLVIDYKAEKMVQFNENNKETIIESMCLNNKEQESSI